MDSKINNNTPSAIEEFISKLPYPVFITVFSSFIFVYLLGLIFSGGLQVYPIYNEMKPDDDCPECRVFNDTKASITERQFRIIYQVVSDLEITRANAWRLLRIKIYGPIFSQEMRANTDNCGLYAYGTKHSAMHFELVQEGPTTVELYCLDKLMLTVSSNVTRYNRNTQSTLFHTSIKEVSNICRVEEQNEEHFVFFSQSNVFNFTNNNQYDYIPRLLHKRQPYEEYINENGATTINNAFRIDYTKQDLLGMSYHELFEKVILVIFVQSHFGQTIIFSYHKNMKDSQYFDFFRRITEGKLKESSNNYKNIYCYQKMTTIPNYKKIKELSESEYEILRSSAVPRDSTRGDKVYLASNFRLADELDKEQNIYFFGEEKVAPPTQSPSPSPSMSPEPSPSQSATPEPTKPELDTVHESNKTSKTVTNKTKKTKSTNTTRTKPTNTTKSKSTNSSSIHDKLKSANKTSLKRTSKNHNITKPSKTRINGTLSKLHNHKSSDHKTNTTDHKSKLNPLKKLNKTVLNKFKNLSSISSKSTHKKSNKTAIHKVNNSSHLASNRTLLSDIDLDSPVLLSYPDQDEPSLQQKIDLLSSAKALIAVDDNESVLQAFWMPRESPLVLIMPPVRTAFSRAAQRINATGRRIVVVRGEREGAEYPGEYEDEARRCLGDAEVANSGECDALFAEMRFRFDTGKVVDIVNNL